MGSDDVVEGRVKGMDSMKSKKCMMSLAVVAGLSAGAAFAGAYSEAFSPKVLPRMSGWVRCANPGDWTVSSDYREADGIGYVKVSMTAPKPTRRPQVEVAFRKADAGDIRTLWRSSLGCRPRDRAGMLPYTGHASFASSYACQMPLYAFLDANDGCVMTLAASESQDRVLFRGGTEEGPNSILATFTFNASDAETPADAWEVTVRCDARRLAADRAIPAAAAWMRRADPSPDYPVPDAAFEPIYQTWCAYHREITDAIVEREADEALKLGLGTVLIDDGWQAPRVNGHFFGEGLPVPRYTDDFAAHVRRLHEKGLKVALWFPMTIFTDDCSIADSFRPQTLYRTSWGPYVWDPRFAERRDYILASLERAVRDWKVDGLKLDFLDTWSQGYSDSWKLQPLAGELGGRDITDLSDGAKAVVEGLRSRLTAINPALTIEFRQMYYGAGIIKGCTQMRVRDCPGSTREMRYGIANLRLTCGPNAVHSDPIQWGPGETDEQVADSILASIFGIGQYSVRLTGDTPSHRKLLAHWVAFENEHRTALYRGDFRVQGLSYDAPVLVGEDKSERIVGAYVPGFVADCGAPDRRIILLNGTGGETLTVHFGAPCAGRILDLFGRETGRIDIPQGVSSVRIPRAGRIVVDAAIGSCR